MIALNDIGATKSLRGALASIVLAGLVGCGGDATFTTFQPPPESYVPATTATQDAAISEVIERELDEAAVYAREIMGRIEQAPEYQTDIPAVVRLWSEDYTAVVLRFSMDVEDAVSAAADDMGINAKNLYEGLALSKQVLLADFDVINTEYLESAGPQDLADGRSLVSEAIDSDFYRLWTSAGL